MTEQKLLLKVLRGEIAPTPPVWLMRQAGRYLPEYRALRERAGTFLDLCYTPELAAEASLQPMFRFGFDATILFSDILLIPHALGSDLEFVDGYGPRLSPVTDASAIAGLRSPEIVPELLSPVYEALRILRREQPAGATLIGFAGSPWTVATYMISGNHKRGREPALAFLKEQGASLRLLTSRLVEATALHLCEQINAGAEVVKLFDTWAGELEDKEFGEFVAEPNRRIVDAVRKTHPDVPIIFFPRGAGQRYGELAAACAANCLAIDHSVAPDWAATELQPHVCVQGNLDPQLLVTGGTRLVEETNRIVKSLAGGPHIFNLGHGITPDAKIGNVEAMLDAVRAN